jgi:malonyl-CoA O-methyltransferase
MSAACDAVRPPTLVFVHGWGFDAGFWDALRVRLRAWPQRTLERGYFSGSAEDEALPDGPLVMIGHSFGCMRMLDRPAPWRRMRPSAWIGINGFARFCAGDDFPQGVDPRMLRRMAARLEAAPADVVDDFRRRCGAAPAGAAPCAPTLAHDLLAMRALDLRERAGSLAGPSLFLSGAEDPVVPARMAAAALPGRVIDWLPGGGHLLPLQDPAWCAGRIEGFLTRHGLAPASRAEIRAPRLAGASGDEIPGVRPGGAGVRFGAAAAGYDRHAGVQREVAARLSARIARLDLPARPRILEIGCGTGMLTRMLGACFPEADWTITDLSPAMLDVARSGLRLGGVARYRVMDGEYPSLEGGPGRFDLICSSMALQWFGDPARGLARLAALLAPAGRLAVALPVHGTFAEWRRAHEALGLRPRMIRFPRPGALRPQCGDIAARVDVERIVEACGGALAFLRDLKGIGATAPRPGCRPLSAPMLRRVCAEFDRAGARCSYRIAYCLWRGGGEPVNPEGAS